MHVHATQPPSDAQWRQHSAGDDAVWAPCCAMTLLQFLSEVCGRELARDEHVGAAAGNSCRSSTTTTSIIMTRRRDPPPAIDAGGAPSPCCCHDRRNLGVGKQLGENG